MSAATATRLACGEYTREEAAAEEQAMRAEHEERLGLLASLSARERQAMLARARRVLPLDLAVDVRDELARAERMAAKVGGERQFVAAPRGARTPRRPAPSRAANSNADDDGPASAAVVLSPDEHRHLVDVFRILNTWYEEASA
jgi:hypothetical protein